MEQVNTEQVNAHNLGEYLNYIAERNTERYFRIKESENSDNLNPLETNQPDTTEYINSLKEENAKMKIALAETEKIIEKLKEENEKLRSALVVAGKLIEKMTN